MALSFQFIPSRLGILAFSLLALPLQNPRAADAGEDTAATALIPTTDGVAATTDYTASGAVPTPKPVGPPLGWHRKANGFFNLSQTYFDNWAKGGTDALTWELNLDGKATYEATKFTLENNGKAVYGRTQIANLDSRKSSDELNLESIATYKLGTWVNPFASLRFQSQFDAGYNYDDSAGTRTRISGPFDPSYLVQTLGIGYTTIPDLKIRLGGTLKETFSDERYGFADDPKTDDIESFMLEPGLSFTTLYSVSIMENILLSTMLDVFVNFQGVDEIDGRWENVLTAKINKYVNVNFGLDMLYDKDLSDSRQIKESLAVGLSFLSI